MSSLGGSIVPEVKIIDSKSCLQNSDLFTINKNPVTKYNKMSFTISQSDWSMIKQVDVIDLYKVDLYKVEFLSTTKICWNA